jgi:hypothetical protein
MWIGRLSLHYEPGARYFVIYGRREYWWWTVGLGPFYALYHKTDAQIECQYERGEE